VARRGLKETPSPHKGNMKTLDTAPVRRKELKKEVFYKKNRYCETRGKSHFL